MNRDIATAIASTNLAHNQGTWYRHSSPNVKELKGSTGGGRWGPEHSFPVIYLGRPIESVTVEAYRRLVDPIADDGIPAHLVGPRVLWTVAVDIHQLLDLRDPGHLRAVGLDREALRGPWGPCQRVAQAAHQIGVKGILVPAATDLGFTLALFEHRLEPHEMPKVLDRTRWDQLPPDPRSPAQREQQIAQRFGN